MREDNIFNTGGVVGGESMIGYKEQISSLTRSIEQKLSTTGGLYVYGLYRMGKTSLLRKIMPAIAQKSADTIAILINLKLYNTNKECSYGEFLGGIVFEIEEELDRIPETDAVKRIREKISAFYYDDIMSMNYRQSFNRIFRYIKNAGLKVLLVIDGFDAAKDVFGAKADYELFRDLTGLPEYSVCLVTISRQELSLIENVDPNNSSLKGVMHPFPVKGFSNQDIRDFCDVLKNNYDFYLSKDNTDLIKYYCGSSPYLWSCIGYEIAEHRLLGTYPDIEEILDSTPVLSEIGGFHDSIFKCLEQDKDRKGVSFTDKLASLIIGPSFLATQEDIKLMISMNYLIDTGTEYLAFSQAFKKYLMETTYSNDILNNFDTLEKKMKLLLETNKSSVFAAAGASGHNDDTDWLHVLSDTWANIEHRTFDDSSYKKQISSTQRRFHKSENVLNVMSLEDATRIVRNYWNKFASKFNNDPLDKWETKLKECGTARNPVHHGSVKRVYTLEEQTRINSYCMEIIKQLS